VRPETMRGYGECRFALIEVAPVSHRSEGT
jgi:hypothetical protein